MTEQSPYVDMKKGDNVRAVPRELVGTFEKEGWVAETQSKTKQKEG